MPIGSRKAGRVDFRRIADVALRSLESLCAEWLPDGRREGHEYKALNPTRADGKVGSFSINLNTGAWADFATGDKGGDAIALYAYLEGCKPLEAAKRLAEKLGVQADTPQGRAGRGGGSDSAAPPRRRTEWEPVLPVPGSAGEPPKAHIKRGKPDATWSYRNAAGELLGVIYRFRTSDGGKEVLPCVYATNTATGAQEWRWLSFPVPRPLYGLDLLKPEGAVLVVEGEKCTDAARSVLPAAISVVSWPGGGKAVDKADWSPIRGRKVIVWPDCDAQREPKSQALLPEHEQPGIATAERIAQILAGQGCDVRIVAIPPPGAKPAGWDVADAIAEGWTAERVRTYIKDNLRSPRSPEESQTPEQAAPPDAWREKLSRTSQGAIVPSAANAHLCLIHMPEWRDVLAYDEFAQRVVKRSPPPFERGVAGDWDAMDDTFTCYWLTRGMPKLSTAQAAEAVESAARMRSFDPVRTYLEGLIWDQVPRLDDWLADYFGAPKTEYTMRVGRWWLIGMVRRVFEPGCKFDFMPILEGPQGRGKSSALEILAHPWFGNTDFVMGDKDSMSVMQGKWLYEVAELDSFNKADSTRVKSFVSRQIDEFRPPYGRRVVKQPRRVVLVGTTNQYEYFKDASGNRRFWPIQCLETINLDGLRDARDQLFAEAVHRYRAGERSYPTREEQEELLAPEQEAREIADAWEEGVHRFLEEVGTDGTRLQSTSGFDILHKGLKLDAGKITKEMTTRVGLVMRKLGWTKRERRGEHPRYVYERPKKGAGETGAPQAMDSVPF